MPLSSRYDYGANLARAASHGGFNSPFWPSCPAYQVFFLDLAPYARSLPDGFAIHLAALRELIDLEWRDSKASAEAVPVLHRRKQIAQVLRELASALSGPDRDALCARAECVEYGHGDERIRRLLEADEQLMVFAGQLSTWFGKEIRPRPAAFGCRRAAVVDATLKPMAQDLGTLSQYLSGLDKRLELAQPPAFQACELFFMAGEANLHPKHIAYFLPEDEGYKRSPLKKTIYFANVHQARLKAISWPLFAEHMGPLPDLTEGHPLCELVPACGVLAHELAHFVRRPQTSYTGLNQADRWASVVLQEVAADVFGTLFVAEVWASALGVSQQDVVSYYLAECLSYVNRGFGLFPDSDGMLLQLNYLAECGALHCEAGASPRLYFDTQAALAGLRSLARVLADTLLNEQVERSLALHQDFGPREPRPELEHLLGRLAARPPSAIEYLQEHICGKQPASKENKS